MNALLLSAGLGTRFRPRTETIAKPAIEFLGLPLMAYMLYYLEQVGLRHLVFNTHHLPQTVESAARRLIVDQDYKIHFSHEPKILGSGGGIRQAEKYLRLDVQNVDSVETVFVVGNADEFLLFKHPQGLKPLIDFHIRKRALATLLTTDYAEAGRTIGGVWCDENNHITRLGGTHSDPNARHFTGVFVFSYRVFDFMPAGGEFHIFKDCLHKAMAAGERVMSYHDPDIYWLDMSSEEEYQVALKKADALQKHDSPYTVNLRKIFDRYTRG